ncbi:MAG: hypothetical protein SAJ12_09630 [Jaaginema sp. PMC 1079.18]|nr:hypothetical protein [Jaaginema sp. PMC 1080.18]MEC4851260.1 hypothetical protein [Jaaginema sp. PMC 1079.18]MEC4864473.1 hypothetical protein [Jaaginema sp. PMC 1078.18]
MVFWRSRLTTTLITLILMTTSLNGAIAKPSLPEAAAKQPDLRRKIFQGRDDEPDYCDLTYTEGWYIWYYDIAGECTIIIAPNEAAASRRAYELFAHSFSVMIVGYGFKANLG